MKYCELREFRCKIMSLNEIPQNHTLYSKNLIESKVIQFTHNLCWQLNINLV